jgi:hypothetical protein
VQTIGWAVGLYIVGFGTSAGIELATMTSVTSLCVLFGACALLLLPETFQQELEVISSEDVFPISSPVLTGKG